MYVWSVSSSAHIIVPVPAQTRVEVEVRRS
jgi:hypothetical protein